MKVYLNRVIQFKRSIRQIDLILLSFITSYAYVIGIFLAFEVDFSSFIYCFLHATLASILMYSIAHKVQMSFLKGRFSIASLTLIITTLYFQLSAIKYIEVQLYSDFITNNNLRLLGSILTFIVIYSSIQLWWWLNQKRKYIELDFKELNLNVYLIYIGVFILTGTYIYNYIKNPTSFYLTGVDTLSSKDQLLIILSSTLSNFLICLAVLYCKPAYIKTYIPIIVLCFCFFFKGLVTGSRMEFMQPFLGVIFAFLIFNKFKISKFLIALLCSSFLIVLISIIFFQFSGRIGGISSEKIIFQLAYRFDLSDFPMTVLNKTSLFKFDIIQIFDGIKMSVPSIIFHDKLSAFGNVGKQQILSDAGLLTNIDYTDTFFSMGTEVAGIFGFLFLYPILIIVFEHVDRYLSYRGRVGFVIKIIIFDFFIRIETEWVSFIPSIRNVILSIIIACILYVLFIKFNKSARMTPKPKLE